MLEEKSKSSPWPNNVGILAIEMYVPNQYVDQEELEKFDGVSKGKYTIGLGQSKMGFCTDREDINSICLTVVKNLMEKHKISSNQIGRIDVGTETIVDKSKSVKTVLMQLFGGNPDIEGVDTINACYGGTAALFNAIAWIESSAWDGRLGLVVTGDIAVYAKGPARPTGGAGAVAMLCGPDAPLILERGLRASHSSNVYEFYKPEMVSEYPYIDGKLSIQCYLHALDKCCEGFVKKTVKKNSERISLESFDAVIFHSPCCKMVQKAFARLFLHDLNNSEHVNDLDGDKDAKLIEKSQPLFENKTKASLYIANQVGNMYTASLYGSLISYLISKRNEPELLKGNRILMFSYGGGSQATMFSLEIPNYSDNDKLSRLLDGLSDIEERLNNRIKVDPTKFTEYMTLREETLRLAPPFTPKGSIDDILEGTYYLDGVDKEHRRSYNRK